MLKKDSENINDIENDPNVFPDSEISIAKKSRKKIQKTSTRSNSAEQKRAKNIEVLKKINSALINEIKKIEWVLKARNLNHKSQKEPCERLEFLISKIQNTPLEKFGEVGTKVLENKKKAEFLIQIFKTKDSLEDLTEAVINSVKNLEKDYFKTLQILINRLKKLDMQSKEVMELENKYPDMDTLILASLESVKFLSESILIDSMQELMLVSIKKMVKTTVHINALLKRRDDESEQELEEIVRKSFLFMEIDTKMALDIGGNSNEIEIFKTAKQNLLKTLKGVKAKRIENYADKLETLLGSIKKLLPKEKEQIKIPAVAKDLLIKMLELRSLINQKPKFRNKQNGELSFRVNSLEEDASFVFKRYNELRNSGIIIRVPEDQEI